MSKSKVQLEKEWNDAAKTLVEKRAACHKADAEKQTAIHAHTRAKAAYLQFVNHEQGLTEGDDCE